VGGQAVQAELLNRLWHDDSLVEVGLLAVDPPLPSFLAWAEGIAGLRTAFREPIYLVQLWRGLRGVDIAHILAASYWSFLLAAAPAWLLARLRGARTLINYRSGEARDHLRRFRSALFVLSRVDEIVVPSGYLVDVFAEFGLKATVVPNLIDLSQFRFRERKVLRPHLVCTRGFAPYYSIDVVVRAFAWTLVVSDSSVWLLDKRSVPVTIELISSSMPLGLTTCLSRSSRRLDQARRS
jgi:glycosyltransferase involved in cell wall biosynthesis